LRSDRPLLTGLHRAGSSSAIADRGAPRPLGQ
jgi:hypothetical protein